MQAHHKFLCLSNKFCKLANPLTIRISYEYERTFRQLAKLQTSHFQEKFLRVIIIFIRIENEHTWSRRIS